MSDELRQVSGNPNGGQNQQSGEQKRKRKERKSPRLHQSVRDVVVLRESGDKLPCGYGDNPALKALMRQHILKAKK